jgi:microcompartment protein CcmK/EutM
MGTVIGRVTLSVRHKRYSGERLLLTLPWSTETFKQESQSCESGTKFDPAIVVYDTLGANVGQQIGISEGREAACPFSNPTPVDAYCAVLVDEFFYKQ